mgnify:CR=1 FL=1
MDEIKEKIGNFFNDAIKNNDFPTLDILYTFYYSLDRCVPDYFYNKEEFWKRFRICCKRNIEKKYSLKLEEKLKYFEDFLMKQLVEIFNSEELLLNTIEFVAEIYKDKVFKIFIENINNKIKNLSESENKIVSFILSYIDAFMNDKEGDFIFDTWQEVPTGRQSWQENIFDLTYTFNRLFNENLKIYQSEPQGRMVLFEPKKIYFFSQLGDALVKIGLGYYVLFSIAHEFRLEFVIPRILYEGVDYKKGDLQIIENFKEKVEKIKKEKEERELIFGKEELEKKEEIVVEEDIKEYIAEHLEIIEEGLSLVGIEFQTPIGYIDILCRDKDKNFVVIEIKREIGSYKVVGQIQKYMAWVMENLAKKEGKEVRGFIVVKEIDEELEYSVKGSKFKIEIKKFGEEEPVEPNIKYCDKCGKPNKKSAKYCQYCGNEFWM